jgi:response regulator RpfG family c-di-GMP phosphodiesterase
VSGVAVAAPTAESDRSVLIVDDEAAVRHLMRRWLESRGYAVSVAAAAEPALDLLATTRASVALCDLRMPGQDGLWLADRLRRDHPDTAVIIATGVDDEGAAAESLRQGVIAYLTKPVERDQLCQAVAKGVEWHRTACDARQWRQRLEDETRTRRDHVERVIAAQFVDSDDDLDVLLAALTVKSLDACAHAYRVAALSVTLARALGCNDEEIASVGQGALFHDVGKLTMPEALLRKPAALTVEELRLIRQHPRIGFELVSQVPYLTQAAEIVRDAQERVDGLGYPSSRKGGVSLLARIVGAADAYDTMTRPRVYRDAIPARDALAELSRCSGSQFDPRVVDACHAVAGQPAGAPWRGPTRAACR